MDNILLLYAKWFSTVVVLCFGAFILAALLLEHFTAGDKKRRSAAGIVVLLSGGTALLALSLLNLLGVIGLAWPIVALNVVVGAIHIINGTSVMSLGIEPPADGRKRTTVAIGVVMVLLAGAVAWMALTASP